MSKIRVLICDAGPADLFADRLSRHIRKRIRGRPDMTFVGRVTGNMNLLVRLARKPTKRRRDLRARNSAADVVFLLTPHAGPMPGICTHVLAEFPDVLMVVVPADAADGMVYRRAITATPAAVATVGNLLRAARLIDADTPPPRGAP